MTDEVEAGSAPGEQGEALAQLRQEMEDRAARRRRGGVGTTQTPNHMQIKEVFLEYLRAGYSVARAVQCMESVSRKTLYVWRNDETQTVMVDGMEIKFAEAWDDAYEQGTEELEDMSVDVGKSGDSKMLMFLLRARNRKKFGQTAVDLRDARGDITINVGRDDLDL